MAFSQSKRFGSKLTVYQEKPPPAPPRRGGARGGGGSPRVRCVAANRRVIAVTPTRRVKSISKLFCIEDLIRRGFI